MSNTRYLDTTADGKATQFEKFAIHIVDCAEALGFPPVNGQLHPDLQQQARDAVYYRWLTDQVSATRSYAKAITAWRKAIRDGALPADLAVPLPPAHEPPPVVPPGIVPRFAALVRAIKNHKNYTPAIGQILGLEGTFSPVLDSENARPDLTGAQVMGDKVLLPWIKGPFDALYVEVDRGDDRGFVFLTIFTRPNGADHTPFPPHGATWKYQAIYLLKDKKVGQWSPVVTVRISG